MAVQYLETCSTSIRQYEKAAKALAVSPRKFGKWGKSSKLLDGNERFRTRQQVADTLTLRKGANAQKESLATRLLSRQRRLKGILPLVLRGLCDWDSISGSMPEKATQSSLVAIESDWSSTMELNRSGVSVSG